MLSRKLKKVACIVAFDKSPTNPARLAHLLTAL
ncbi:MAG: hypothetical protein QOH63_2359 [Acidobacteriota bacterium]|jgi:hypothetical protein|nr:hypothetical protein [Acidobacteriota bacterium]